MVISLLCSSFELVPCLLCHLTGACIFFPCVQSIVADMRKVLAKNPQIEQQKLHRRVFLENIDPENQALMVNMLCNNFQDFFYMICETPIDLSL